MPASLPKAGPKGEKGLGKGKKGKDKGKNHEILGGKKGAKGLKGLKGVKGKGKTIKGKGKQNPVSDSHPESPAASPPMTPTVLEVSSQGSGLTSPVPETPASVAPEAAPSPIPENSPPASAATAEDAGQGEAAGDPGKGVDKQDQVFAGLAKGTAKGCNNGKGPGKPGEVQQTKNLQFAEE